MSGVAESLPDPRPPSETENTEEVIRGRAAKAHPWRFADWGDPDDRGPWMEGETGFQRQMTDADLAYVEVVPPQTVLALLDRIARLEGDRERLKDALIALMNAAIREEGTEALLAEWVRASQALEAVGIGGWDDLAAIGDANGVDLRGQWGFEADRVLAALSSAGLTLVDTEALATAMWTTAPGRLHIGPASRPRSAEFRRWAEKVVAKLRATESEPPPDPQEERP